MVNIDSSPHTATRPATRPFISRLAAIAAMTLLLALGLAPAVFAQQVSVEFDESVDFTKFKTFALKDGRMTSRAPALNSALTKKRIETEIVRALTARGLSVVTEQADLNVSFEFGSARTTDSRAYPVGWRGRGTRVVQVSQSEGTLAIDLHDAATNSLVWRGIATEAEPNPIKLADKLDKLVKKPIAKYPPKKK